jgi:Asp-tRNA(Asn)/Glu-tRNA(Gln) amidotransferase A subunit family amidase
VLSGPDPRDPQTLVWAPVDPLPTLRRGVAGLRLGVMPDAERAGVDKDVLAAYDAAVETLGKLGGRIVRPALPHRFSDYAAATGRIIGAEGYRFVGHLVDDESLPVDPHIRPRIQIGRGVSARDYLLALGACRRNDYDGRTAEAGDRSEGCDAGAHRLARWLRRAGPTRRPQVRHRRDRGQRERPARWPRPCATA